MIEEDAEALAERFLEAVRVAVAKICKHPGIGAPKALNQAALGGLRSWPVKGFPAIRVYYLTSESVIRLIRVLHGKRDIDPLLDYDDPYF